MPEKITAYRCKYRCGQRVNTKKESIRLHENICFLNPKSKACRTCGLRGFESEFGYYCSEEHLPDDKMATFNCEWWEFDENE